MLQTLPSAEREAVLQLVSEDLVARDGPELSAEVRGELRRRWGVNGRQADALLAHGFAKMRATQ